MVHDRDVDEDDIRDLTSSSSEHDSDEDVPNSLWLDEFEKGRRKTVGPKAGGGSASRWAKRGGANGCVVLVCVCGGGGGQRGSFERV